MRPDIPRYDGNNPPSGQSSASTAVTWYAFLGDREPPLAVGRTPEEARDQLREAVLRHFTEDADPPELDPQTQTAAELEHRRDDVLLSGTGKDEATAFRAWRFVSCLSDEEALRRWRRVFAAPEGEDPLEGDRPRRAAQR